jgi:hypothetical protein
MHGKMMCNGFNGTNNTFNRDMMRGKGKFKTFFKDMVRRLI